MNIKLLAAIVVLVVSAVAGWGVVFSMGSIPATDGTIHGCFRNHKNDNEVQGWLRVVSELARCKKNETQLSWNQPVAAGGGAILHTAAVGLPSGPNSTSFSIGASLCVFEVDCRTAAPRSGTLSNLFVVPSQAPAAGAVMIVTVRVNGVDFSLGITHTAADWDSVKSNITDSVSVSPGDLISVRFTETGGLPTARHRSSFEFR
jgi:hypothetical protein